MASASTYIAAWFRHHLSSVISFKKQFVDDVSEKVKERKAQFDRHTREAKERAVQLHLDEMEEKYLCCVCGRGGEIREDDEYVYDTYSMINLPPQAALEAAVREELADDQLSDRRIKQHQHMLASPQRHLQQSSATAAATYESDSGISFSSDVSIAPSDGRSKKTKKRLGRRRDVSSWDRRAKSFSPHRVVSPSRCHREELEAQHQNYDDGYKNAAADVFEVSTRKSVSVGEPSLRSTAVRGGARELHSTDLAVMDPDMVGPLEVRHTLSKIRHAVLHTEARVRRKAAVVHRDKGLMMIEESEIEMFSHFFQRPVHGYICMACYTSAQRRLDTLTQQIRGILFKAEHPVLRRLSAKELEGLIAGNQLPATLIQSVLAIQRRWARLTEEQQMELSHTETGTGSPQGAVARFDAEERTRWVLQQTDLTTPMTTLPEKSILTLRDEARCGACQRHSACFFEPRSAVFLCQFCTARDRFYREHAVCINDEEMPAVLAHLLQHLALYYQGVHEQAELRQTPLSAIPEAHTDLFPLTVIMREKEGLFACQAPSAVKALQGYQEVAEGESTLRVTTPTLDANVLVARPCTSAATTRQVCGSAVPLHEQRGRVGRTMISLFDGIEVEGSGVNLFKNTTSASFQAGVSDLLETTPAPQLSPTPTNGGSAGYGGEGAAADLLDDGGAASLTSPPATIWGHERPLQSSVAGSSFATSTAHLSEAPNPQWESLF